MKKVICASSLIILLVVFSSCNSSKTILQTGISANAKQSQFIESTLLEQLSIECASIKSADMGNPILEDLDENWEAYDLISKDDLKYILILRKSDKDLACVLNDKNELVFGLAEGSVIPKYFEFNEGSNEIK